jgi:hypothetical protein
MFDIRASVSSNPFQENTMKALMIAVTIAVSATTGVAYAADYAPANVEKSVVVHLDPSTQGNNTLSRTRAQVRAELAQAQKNGQLSYLNSTLYRGGN